MWTGKGLEAHRYYRLWKKHVQESWGGDMPGKFEKDRGRKPGRLQQETLEGTAIGNSVRKSIYQDGIGPWTPW